MVRHTHPGTVISTFRKELIVIHRQISSDQSTTLMFQRKQFNDLLNDRKQFWQESLLPEDDRRFWRSRDLQLFSGVYFVLCFVAVVVSILYSYRYNELLVPVWYPAEYPWLRACFYYSQWVWLIFVAVFECGLICLYNALCYEVVTQFQILACVTGEVLNDCIRKKETGISSKMKELLCHHSYLMR